MLYIQGFMSTSDKLLQYVYFAISVSMNEIRYCVGMSFSCQVGRWAKKSLDSCD